MIWDKVQSCLLTFLFAVASYGLEEPQLHISSTDRNVASIKIYCRGKLAKISSSDELYDKLLPQIMSESDSATDATIKKDFLKYLVLSEPFMEMIRCKMLNSSQPQEAIHKDTKNAPLQEDEDDDGGDGGDASSAAANGAGDNSNLIRGVTRILQNVFNGNLIGIVQEGVGLRSPMGVSNVVTDVLASLFGSAATANATGIIGNITMTSNPIVKGQSSTVPTNNAYFQQYLQQQQSIQQLKEIGILDQAQAVAAQQHLLQWQQQKLQQGHGVGVGVAPGNGVEQYFQQSQILGASDDPQNRQQRPQPTTNIDKQNKPLWQQQEKEDYTDYDGKE